MSDVHLKNLPPYADLAQAMYGVKLGLAYVRGKDVDGEPVDSACGLKGLHTGVDFGLSYFPHDKVNMAAPSGTPAELCDKVESLMPGDTVAAAGVVPWGIIVPILLELLARLLKK